MKGFIRRYAETQKIYFDNAAISQSVINNPLHSKRFQLSAVRKVRRQLSGALDIQQEMLRLAFERPEDSEEFTNFDMAGAISRLTQSRINRLAYAGRVLP